MRPPRRYVTGSAPVPPVLCLLHCLTQGGQTGPLANPLSLVPGAPSPLRIDHALRNKPRPIIAMTPNMISRGRRWKAKRTSVLSISHARNSATMAPIKVLT